MKTFLLAAVLLATVSISHAQNLSLGPTAGFGHAFISEDDNKDNHFWPAYNVGLKVVYSFVTNWGISADIKFSGEGGKNSIVTGADKREFEYRANYVRVPIQGIYFFGKLGDAVRPKISVGPSLGFLVGGESEARLNGALDNRLKTKDILEGFDFGVTGAIGANFKLGGGKWLNTDIGYYHGITNVAQTLNIVRNRNLGINVGLTFPIGTVTPDKD